MRNKISIQPLLYIFAVVTILSCVCLPIARPMIEVARVEYIIDAGHGLPDGGAVAPDGTCEEYINLSICKKLHTCFENGSAILTRSDENGLWTNERTIREKKIADMRARVEFANRYPNAFIISVHLNTFSDSNVYGCQVFYREGDANSLKRAKFLQDSINETLQPENPKVAKPISSKLYLFSHTSNPALLIECGFLTNSNELNKLKNEEYQNKIAKLIFNALKS